ncbi:hypothetical protein [Allostreptomyces psammosilenae]|uniref:Uncharacterized protein n=1 Tax=Allostreptomyces psammosilenae TaxID=1892865 RepID=A0A852ZXR8_9ACTN|nr:hypothetical protein [Allostreptomyces psammosilenae]NYI07136.1 hypothetical protein [Allostreptomyces psammosilenae]
MTDPERAVDCRDPWWTPLPPRPGRSHGPVTDGTGRRRAGEHP